VSSESAAPGGGTPPPLGDLLLAAYLSTEVVDDTGRVWSGAVADVDIADPTWVITAENPFSRRQDPAANAAAMASLVSVIRADGFAPVELRGRAPDESWSEDCLAVVGPAVDRVCAWGRAYAQHAVFLLTPSTHAVVSCWTEQEVASRPRRTWDPASSGGPEPA